MSTLELEVGKSYKSRCGDRWNVISRDDDYGYILYICVKTGTNRESYFTSSGKCRDGSIFPDNDLIEEWCVGSVKHKHADVIIAWANGSVIQYQWNGQWCDVNATSPSWSVNYVYRIKPVENTFVKRAVYSVGANYNDVAPNRSVSANLELEFTPDGVLVSAKVI